jgi:hypothetical protein
LAFCQIGPITIHLNHSSSQSQVSRSQLLLSSLFFGIDDALKSKTRPHNDAVASISLSAATRCTRWRLDILCWYPALVALTHGSACATPEDPPVSLGQVLACSDQQEI